MSANIHFEIAGSGKLAITQEGMTGTRIARCDWDKWPATCVALMGTPIFFAGFMQVVGRQSWPGIPYMLVDSVDVEGMGRMRKSTWDAGPRYDYAKLTINYQVPKSEDDKDENGQPAVFLIESLDYSVDVAVVPVQVVDEVDKEKMEKEAKDLFNNQPSSNADGEPVEPQPVEAFQREPRKKSVKRHIRIPTITYSTTMPRLPQLPGAAIREAVGKVNKKSIFGGKPGTVLFDGPQAERESAFFTQRTWRVSYKFIYQQFGWNNQLHPDTLNWVPAKGIGSDNDPYQYYDLKKLFPAPYKVSS